MPAKSTKPPPEPRALTPKEEAWCMAVAAGQFSVDAYIEHISEGKCQRNTAWTAVWQLNGRTEIAMRIAELKAGVKRLTEERFNYDCSQLAKDLIDIIKTPIGSIDENHWMAQEMTYEIVGGKQGKLKQGEAEEGNERETPIRHRVRVKIPSKIDAAKLLASLCGYTTETKVLPLMPCSKETLDAFKALFSKE